VVDGRCSVLAAGNRRHEVDIFSRHSPIITGAKDDTPTTPPDRLQWLRRSRATAMCASLDDRKQWTVFNWAFGEGNIRLRVKFRLNLFILSPSGGENPQILRFFGIRHFVVSPGGGNLRKSNTGAQPQTFRYPAV